MEIITLTAGTLWGIACGFFVCTIPGLSQVQAMWAASAIAFVFPQALPAALVSSIGCGLIVNSVKQALTPHLSGDVYTLGSISEELEEISPKWMLSQLTNAKLWGIAIAALCILFFPGSANSSLLSWLLAAFIILFLNSSSLPTMLMYIGFVQIALWLCNVCGVAYPVYAIASCMFVIPTALQYAKFGITGTATPKIGVNLISLTSGVISTLFAPSVNPNAIVQSVAKPGVTNLLTSAAGEAFVECYGLLLLTKGIVNGKTSLAIELGHMGSINFSLVFIFFLSLFLGLCLKCNAWNNYCKSLQNYQCSIFVTLVVGSFTCFVTAGILAVVLIPAGCAIAYKMRGSASSIRSSLFLGSII